MRWSIGIDPGFGMTGVVLLKASEQEKVVDAAVFSCGASAGNHFERTISLSASVVDQVCRWITDHKITHLDIGIETPIFGKHRNANVFSLQWRLIQELESGLVYVPASFDGMRELWITEIHNKTSKMLATGSGEADKPAMIAASPFNGNKEFDQSRLEALADAWAHSLCTWDVAGVRMNATEQQFVEVRS
jgi:Holliday junction resolvasome RuvABC endonuclease subunit